MNVHELDEKEGFALDELAAANGLSPRYRGILFADSDEDYRRQLRHEIDLQAAMTRQDNRACMQTSVPSRAKERRRYITFDPVNGIRTWTWLIPMYDRSIADVIADEYGIVDKCRDGNVKYWSARAKEIFDLIPSDDDD